MLSIRTILSASLLFNLLPFIYATTPEQEQEGTVDVATFRQLLDQVDPPALHEALHSYSPKKFQHGMFQEDRTAVEVIHRTQPNLATNIINLAKRSNNEIKAEFVKRQEISNGTTPTTTPAGNSPEPATSRVNPVAPIATNSAEATSSPEATSPAATPVVVPITSTAANGSPVVGSSTLPTPSPTSAAAGANSISLTAGEVITTTNGVGLTIISTVGGGARTITPTKGASSANGQAQGGATSVQYQTSTLPNGSKSVVTAVTVVGGANQAGQTPSGTAGVGQTTTGSNPGLQTGEAAMTRAWRNEMLCVVGGAVVVAGLL